MKYVLATTMYILTVLSFMQNWFLLAVFVVLVFSLRYSALIFIPTAVVLDGYYGLFHTIPILSICAVVWYIAIEFLRPKLTELVL
tara:strand:+ start:743 stop:997 length:255 start_codon:yes stop_codon:yes gene_type:complete